MSIWLGETTPNVALTDGALFGVLCTFSEDYTWWHSGSMNTLKEMNRLGWGLIAPATLSEWGD